MSCVSVSAMYCGEVKNVGFRRQPWRIANRLGLSGFAINVDGADCVAVYVEGVEGAVDEFFEHVSRVISKFDVREQRSSRSGICIRTRGEFTLYSCVRDALAEIGEESLKVTAPQLAACVDART